MFAAIYRGYIKPGYEDQYQRCWKTVATYFLKERGALGSTLHKTENGMWVAYSRWPDKETRDASWPQGSEAINSVIPLDIQEAIKGLKECLDSDRQLPEICMTVKESVSS